MYLTHSEVSYLGWEESNDCVALYRCDALKHAPPRHAKNIEVHCQDALLVLTQSDENIPVLIESLKQLLRFPKSWQDAQVLVWTPLLSSPRSFLFKVRLIKTTCGFWSHKRCLRPLSSELTRFFIPLESLLSWDPYECNLA